MLLAWNCEALGSCAEELLYRVPSQFLGTASSTNLELTEIKYELELNKIKHNLELTKIKHLHKANSQG